MADANNNFGPTDQSKQLVDEIQKSIKQILRLTKQIGHSEAARNSIAEEYNNRLKDARGNTTLLKQLNEELSNRINSVAQNTDEYGSDISSVTKELNRIVGQISITSDFSRTVLKDFKTLRDVAFNIRNDKDLTRVMSIEELKNSKEQVNVTQKSLEIQVQRAAAELNFNTIVEAVKAGQQAITDAIIEQDAAIREASGRLGGQIAHIKALRAYKSDINEEHLKENVSQERSVELSEQRNSIAEELRKESSSITDKESEQYIVLESIITKLEEGVRISLKEHGVIERTLNAREEGYRKQSAEAIEAAQAQKKNAQADSKKLDLARSIISELVTTGKLEGDSVNTLQDKVAILENNQNLLVGLSNTEKTRLLKAIEVNKELVNSKTLFQTLQSEIDASVKREEDLVKTMGFTGNLVKELSKIPVLSTVFKAEDVKEVTDEIRRLNKEAEDIASLKTQENRNNLINTFTELQESSNSLTEDQSKSLTEIITKLENREELSSAEKQFAEELSGQILETTQVEEQRKEVLEKIATLSSDDQKAIKLIQEKVENRKQLTEDELKILEEKTGVNAKNLNIDDQLLKNIKEQGFNIKVNAEKVSQLGAASKMLGKVWGNLTDILTDPVAILTAIGAALVRNSKLTNEFQQELGISYGNALAIRNQLGNAANASNDLFINSEKLQKSFFALKESTGVFFDLTSQSAETFTNLTERIGLAGAEAGNLTMLMRLQGKETENTLGNIYNTTGAMLQTSKTTASVKDILGDVAKTSKGLQASLAANPQALAKAAIAAREFGSTLAELEGIQKNLLNFEQSIEAELKAELLTGKQLNLERARAAALNNDMKTLGEELKKQNIDLASFGNMNVLQQEAIAEAMGMNRDSLAETLLRQEMQNKTLSEIRSTMGEQAYEQAKALSAQDKFNAAVAKVKDLFATVMTALTPVIDVLVAMSQPIAWIAKWIGKLNELTGGWSNGLIGVAIAARALGVSFGSLFNPATYASLFTGLKDKLTGLFTPGTTTGLFTGLKDKFKGTFNPETTSGFFSGIKDKFKGLAEPLKGFKDKIVGVFGGAADKAAGIEFDPRMAGGGRFRDMASGRLVSEEAANAAGVFKPGTGPAAAAASGVTDAASATGATPAPADNGKALKEKMQNIAEGIKSFANKEVIKGALSMIVAAPGLIALGIASLPLKITEKLNGKALKEGMKGIALGLKAFGDPKVILGGLALIPISLGLAAMAVGSIGLAGIALFGAPAAASMAALAAGLTALGSAAATGLPFLGVGLIAALGASLIPFGLALGFAAPLIEAVGNTIANVLTAVANAIVTIIPALTQSLIDLATQIPIGGLLALALALPGLGVGLVALGTGLILAAPGLLIGAGVLSLITPVLGSLNDAVSGIDGANFALLGAGIIGLASGLTLLGLAGPLAIVGAGVLSLVSLALIPLGAALAYVSPGLDKFNVSLSSLSNIGLENLAGLAIGIGALGLVVSGLATMAPMIVIGSGALAILGLSLYSTAEAFKKVAGVGAESMTGFAASVAMLGGVAALLGTMAGLVALGSGVMYLLGKAIDPAAEAISKVAGVGAESMVGFATAVGMLGIATVGLGLVAPLAILGAGALFVLGKSIAPAAEAMKNLGNVSAESMIGFAGAIKILGGAASYMGLLAPLVALGAGTIHLLGKAIVPATEAMKNLMGIEASSMIGFSAAISLLGNAATKIGLLAPLVLLGSGAIAVLGMAIVPAAEAMKNLAGISADAIVAFSTGLSMLGSTATMLGIVSPLVVLGAGALYVLGNALTPAAEAFALLEGLDASSMLGFAGALNILGTASALFGVLSPAILLGSGALYILGNAIMPAVEAFKLLEGLDPAVMAGFANSLFVLGSSAAFFGGLFPLVLLGAGAIAVLGLALKPLANLAPQLNLTNTALAGIAGSIGLLSTSLVGLDTSKLTELAEFGESLNITSNIITETPTASSTEPINQNISSVTPTDSLINNTKNLSTTTSNAAAELETFTEKVKNTNISESTKQKVIAAKSNAEIVPGISVATPSPTTTQETLTTNTENLSTATSNAAINLEKLTTVTANILPTTTSPTQLAQGTTMTEVTPVNLEPPTEIVPGISVVTPKPETTNVSTLERILTLTTEEINTAIGLLDKSKADRSINLDTLDILKAKAAFVDLRDGKQDISSERFSNDSLKIVESVISTINELGTNTKLQQIGEQITGAEISVIEGPGFKEEKVNFFSPKEPELGSSIKTPKGVNIQPTVSSNAGTLNTPTVQQGITAEDVEGIVASTIKALVPEMVSALNNVKVVNDNFHNSKQSEGPSRNRQITNNNFA